MADSVNRPRNDAPSSKTPFHGANTTILDRLRYFLDAHGMNGTPDDENMPSKLRSQGVKPTPAIKPKALKSPLIKKHKSSPATPQRSKTKPSSSSSSLSSPQSSSKRTTRSTHSYPISETVRELEESEQKARAKCRHLEKDIFKLQEEVYQLHTKISAIKAEADSKYKGLEEEYTTKVRELEEEKSKTECLRLRNEDLVVSVDGAKEDSKILAQALESKSFESFVFRCALAATFKSIPTIREKFTMRKVVEIVLAHYHNKHNQENSAYGDQNNNSNSEDDTAAMPDLSATQDNVDTSPPAQHRPSTPIDGGSDLENEGRFLKRKAKNCAESHRHWGTKNDDSDDESALVDILERRAKRLKAMHLPSSPPEMALSE